MLIKLIFPLSWNRDTDSGCQTAWAHGHSWSLSFSLVEHIKLCLPSAHMGEPGNCMRWSKLSLLISLGMTSAQRPPYVVLCVLQFSPREQNAAHPVNLPWTKNHSWSTAWPGCLFHVLTELPHQLCLSTGIPSRYCSPAWMPVPLHPFKKEKKGVG